MTCRAKILSLVVIAALAWTASAWSDETGAHNSNESAIPGSATPNEPPDSCHVHGRMGNPVSQNEGSPAPVPSNYKCCLTGHDAAIVQSVHSQGPLVFPSGFASQVQLAPVESVFGTARASALLCADPPNITSLRI